VNSKEETHKTFVPITSKNSTSGGNPRVILTITIAAAVEAVRDFQCHDRLLRIY
jgi:hypothetical protein